MCNGDPEPHHVLQNFLEELNHMGANWAGTGTGCVGDGNHTLQTGN